MGVAQRGGAVVISGSGSKGRNSKGSGSPVDSLGTTDKTFSFNVGNLTDHVG